MVIEFYYEDVFIDWLPSNFLYKDNHIKYFKEIHANIIIDESKCTFVMCSINNLKHK